MRECLDQTDLLTKLGIFLIANCCKSQLWAVPSLMDLGYKLSMSERVNQ